MAGLWGPTVWLVDACAYEAMLFAAVGFLTGGLDDLAIDLIHLVRRATGRQRDVTLADLPHPAVPGRMAIFVAAWDESRVIGAMLRTACARMRHPDVRIFVGCYPNDPATIAAVAAVAEDDPRVRVVIGADDGPTTKAACLNAVWRALLRDDAETGLATRAVVLHDAEDVVHGDELTVHDAYLGEADVVQVPVLPLIDRRAPLVSGHYADEFSESHSKVLAVRVALGAGMPLAGTGCAIAMPMLAAIAAQNGGTPFDASSLVEDYEMGLNIARLGGRSRFARVREVADGPLVAVRAYFPSKRQAAIRQKARWMTGIALAGWDRTGWARTLDPREHWMRIRDRRAPLAVLVLAVGYCAMLLLAVSLILHGLEGSAPRWPGGLLASVLWINLWLLVWRIVMRTGHVAAAHGVREAAWAVPRMLMGNYIALFAVRRAMADYGRVLRGGVVTWDKTAHEFPDIALAG